MVVASNARLSQLGTQQAPQEDCWPGTRTQELHLQHASEGRGVRRPGPTGPPHRSLRLQAGCPPGAHPLAPSLPGRTVYLFTSTRLLR